MSKSITVVICTYNSSLFIKKTISSIINQSLVPDKIIIVDDNSNDLEILKKLIDKFKNQYFKNIELISCTKNKGPGYNRNLAWSYCNSEFIAFCDDDDYWHKDKLKIQIKILNNNKNIKLIASKKKYLDHVQKFNNQNINTNLLKLSFFKLLFKNYIPTSSVVCRSKLKDRFLHAYYAEDYFLWLSILKKNYECYLINDYLCGEIKIKKKIKLSSDIKKIHLGVQNVLSQFYSDKLLNNTLISFAKFYYYLKMILKIMAYGKK